MDTEQLRQQLLKNSFTKCLVCPQGKVTVDFTPCWDSMPLERKLQQVMLKTKEPDERCRLIHEVKDGTISVDELMVLQDAVFTGVDYHMSRMMDGWTRKALTARCPNFPDVTELKTALEYAGAKEMPIITGG